MHAPPRLGIFRRASRAIDAGLAAVFGSLTTAGKVWMWAGLITLAGSMGMAYDYASQVSGKHGIMMAACGFATAFLIEESYKRCKEGLYGVGIALAVISIPMFWQESKSHIAYTAGFRGINVERASLQQTRYDDGRDDIEKARATLTMFEGRLVELQKSNAWAVTVTADALRAKLASLNLAIDLEAKRGGCKAKCLERTSERDDAASRIAVLERIDDTTKKVEAAKAVIANYRDKVAKLEHKPSIVSHQNTTLVKIAALLTHGSSESSDLLREGVELENTVGLALMPVILPALCFFMMGLHRKEDDPAPIAKTPDTTSADLTLSLPPRAAFPTPADFTVGKATFHRAA